MINPKCLVIFFLFGLAPMVLAQYIIDMSRSDSQNEIVLFPFDNYSVPFRHGLQLELHHAKRHADKPVITLGDKNSPDGAEISYYGTVLYIAGQFRMWYIARGFAEKNPRRICYAISEDGYNWRKPDLGLVSYAGSTQNNLVDLDFGGRIMSCNVIFEPDEPNPSRRYKIFCEVKSPQSNNQGNVAFSADGLHWQTSPKNPVTHTRIEPSGLIKRNGCYYINGQNAGTDRAFQKRVLLTLASYDFENWTDAGIVGFRRDAFPPRSVTPNYQAGPQVHLGASLWDRGNVILGFYGQWNAPLFSEDRRDMRMDIGLIVSHDGLHYIEPIPDFKIIQSREEGWRRDNPLGDPPRLAQGQGVFNIEDKTITYYSVWGSGGNSSIRMATWERDRLGFFHCTANPIEGQTWIEAVRPHFISAPIKLPKNGGKVFLNADFLSEYGRVKVEILDKQFQPLVGYTSHQQKLFQKNSGFRIPVVWKQHQVVYSNQPVRIRIFYEGIRPEDVRIYAVYVGNAQN
jgi:hypothetical protein